MFFNQLYINVSVGFVFCTAKVQNYYNLCVVVCICFVLLPLLFNSATNKLVHTSLKLFSLVILFFEVKVQRKRIWHIL